MLALWPGQLLAQARPTYLRHLPSSICLLGGLESFNDVRGPLLGLDVERLPAARLHLLLPHLLLQDSHLPGPLGRLLLLALQLGLNLLPTVYLERV